MIAGLPYDAEVEYLESTGTQWIDTVIAFSDSSHTYKWEITAQNVNKSSDNYKWFCGYFTGNVYCCGTYSDLYTLGAFYPTGKYYANGVEISSPITATDKKYDVVKNIYSINGLGVSSAIPLFTRRITSDGTVSTSGQLRVYACKLYDNANLVRDFIPVRVGSVGYMYDRVTRKLFGNAGTGAFVLGPDVAKPVMTLRRYPSQGGMTFGKIGARRMVWRLSWVMPTTTKTISGEPSSMFSLSPKVLYSCMSNNGYGRAYTKPNLRLGDDYIEFDSDKEIWYGPTAFQELPRHTDYQFSCVYSHTPVRLGIMGYYKQEDGQFMFGSTISNALSAVQNFNSADFDLIGFIFCGTNTVGQTIRYSNFSIRKIQGETPL